MLGITASTFRRLFRGRSDTPSLYDMQSPRQTRTSPRSPGFLGAKYDAAQTTDDNSNHWAASDALSADAANSLGVRTKLRNRARYEIANNSYAKGLVLTIANDEIGTGPNLNIKLPRIGDTVEGRWREWDAGIKLPAKLRTMVMARCGDGEGFGQFVTGPRRPVSLDVKLFECDLVTSPILSLLQPNKIDGIEFDANGNPTVYEVLDSHPGGPYPLMNWTPRRIAARSILHLFRCDRPGQHRGVPELSPSLGLFAELRRYTQAVIAAAETAADMAVLLKTAMNASVDPVQVAPLSTVDFERRMMTALPAGWDAYQIDPKQPPPSYGDFKREILNEIARCLNVPYNVAACNSSSYNYASGRLDHQTYWRSIEVNRGHIETVVLDPIFAAWWFEAVRAYHFDADPYEIPPHEWHWPALTHVDPRLVAESREIALRSGVGSPAIIAAEDGYDYQAVKESAAKAYGITVAEYESLVRSKTFGVSGVNSVANPQTADSLPQRTTDQQLGNAS